MLDRTDPAPTSDTSLGTALRDALRRARAEAADRTDVVIDMRHAEIARLELLRDELEPVFAQVPREVDIFDVGLSQGDRPRLFVDMVSFVEMGRDRRLYRFVRDGRHGRAVAAESERTGPIVEAVTAYVARRLIERERLLADEDRLVAAAPSEPAVRQVRPLSGSSAEITAAEAPPGSEPAASAASDAAPPVAAKPHGRRGWLRALTILLAFSIGGALGAAVVVALIFAVAKGVIPL